MIILPAIDMLSGKCVRLTQGDYASAGQTAPDILEAAKNFEAAGAKWLHMVDLDAACEGRLVNTAQVKRVLENTSLKVELGGGIRSFADIDACLALGVSRVILGSVAVKDPEMTRAAAEKYGEKIAVGIDARDGLVRTSGWLVQSEINYLCLAEKMEKSGVKTLIFTDISRDGMLNGLNIEQLAALKAAVSCNIIASGGVKDLIDVKKCAEMGLYGVICGRSLYNGTLRLEDALGAC